MEFFLIYLAVISIIACAATISDKDKAKRDRRRIPERTLFLLAIMGGSAAMYITMNIIRHKTKHKRFMIGLPLIIFAQCIAGFLILNEVIFPYLPN